MSATPTSPSIGAAMPPSEPTPLVVAQNRVWAWCGIGAGMLGLVGFFLAGGVAVDTDALADNQLVAEAVTDSAGLVWAYQVVTVATAILVAVFAAGLFRKLSQQGPAQSLCPMLAVSGLLLVSAMSLVGGGICTEMFWGLTRDTAELDPDTVAAQMAILNTMAWVWAGAGLAAAAVAVAGLRHGAVSRALGTGSAVAAGLIALTNLVPLQYMALIPGALWLIAAGISFVRAEQ
jgi:magnesium-transporting ATPase (P-type)